MNKPPYNKITRLHAQELEQTVSEQQGMTFKVKKIDGRFIHTFCAGQLLARMGLSPEMVIGYELKDFFPQEIAQSKELFYDKAWQGADSITYEGHLQDLWYLASLRPIKRRGKVVEVIATCIDITDRKQAEEVLKSTKEWMEALFENSADGICLTDMRGTVIRVNTAFEKIYGWSNKELQGNRMPNLSADEKYTFEEIYQKLHDGAKVLRFETTRRRKDGERIFASVTMTPIKDKEGKIIALTGMTRDITESKKSEDFLRKADKLHVAGQLAAGLVHEIRNPLTSLRGFLQMMRYNPHKTKEYSEIMLSEVDRISSIINDFLLLSKPQVSHFQLNDMSMILKHVVALIEPQAVLKNIELQLDIEEGIPHIPSSEMEIKQVFINLLKNALEAMNSSGVVRISARLHHGQLVIRVMDQGCGIDQHLLARLGEPFFTTKLEGTGLGLMMCYKIIKDHHGSINVTSVVGEGTTFEVVLPCYM